MGAALERIARRYHGRPLAGVLLFTDGSATDLPAIDRLLTSAKDAGGSGLPPIYPVIVGREGPASDIGVEQIAVTQTNFEDAPVTLTAQVTSSGYTGRSIVAQLFDEAGKLVEQQTVQIEKEGQPLVARFKVRPEKPGVSFYRVRVAAENELWQFDTPEKSPEATLANNTRMAVVDRGKGPYRVLYVSGRPNWEFKFLNRSIQSDDQVQLMGLLRIAKREPKFNFIGRGERSNPLFQGFNNQNTTEQADYDKPVLIRVGAVDENELRGGFPKTAEELYRYHAIIVDDIESEFFTQDQMQLLKEFVRQRGGGMLMLGGMESFKNGRYDRTPIGELLPVYCDDAPTPEADAHYRLNLTREGWLEPWVRLRGEEDTERQRLGTMPPFQILNSVRGIKPGATVLARASTENGTPVPALVEQRFGRGRVAALLIGDLWRWDLHRPADAPSDMEKAWRQTIRWLVGEVPQRVEVTATPRRDADDAEGTLVLAVQVRDPAYAPLDNAAVTIKVTGPDGKAIDLRTDPSANESGRYEAIYGPRQAGAYRAQVAALGPDGVEIAQTQTGWTADPAAEEFRELQPNRELLNRIATATGGEVVRLADIDSFVKTLPSRHAQVTEPFVQPAWHQSWVFLIAIACLAAEWGLRRWKGLP
jgi:uncharacterized membrane protein